VPCDFHVDRLDENAVFKGFMHKLQIKVLNLPVIWLPFELIALSEVHVELKQNRQNTLRSSMQNLNLNNEDDDICTKF